MTNETTKHMTREEWLSQFRDEYINLPSLAGGDSVQTELFKTARLRLFETIGQNVSVEYLPQVKRIGKLWFPVGFEIERKLAGDVFGPTSYYPLTPFIVPTIKEYVSNNQTILDGAKEITNYNLAARSAGQEIWMMDLSTLLKKRFPKAKLSFFR